MDQPNGFWYPLVWRLSVTPTKETIFCDVYKSITPIKGKIFCDVYKYRAPTKGKIFYDVYKFRIPTKGKISFDIYKYRTPTKGKIFCDIYKYRKPPKSTIFCDVYKLISKNSKKIVKLEEPPWSQSIYWLKQVQLKNWNPLHKLPQTCGGRKYICPVWIWCTDNLLSHLRTSFRINNIWPNKYDTHKSTINKRRLEQISWRIF